MYAMNSSKILVLICLAAGIATVPHVVGAQHEVSSHAVTTDSLLHEMVDRDIPARSSSPRYMLKQFSSHDITKRDPADAATWHSNRDYEQFIRTETVEGRREWVIMDAKGPGAITRFWLPLDASRDNQIVRFYLDGSPTPVIAAKFNDLLSGRSNIPPPFAFVAWDEVDLTHQIKSAPKTLRGVAGDMYFPIPFAHSCKVTLDQIPFYYIINYREYEPHTAVKTFTRDEIKHIGAGLQQISTRLLSPEQIEARSSAKLEPVVLAAGERNSINLPSGSHAVRNIHIELDPHDLAHARSTVLEATFDGENTVWCPLSELSGGGPRLHPVSDWDRSVYPDGTISLRFTMPYRDSGVVSLHNYGQTPVRASITTTTSPWRWSATSMHFHATWHSEHNMKTRPMSDWNYLQFSGGGRYVGDTLSVYSPVGEWCGEGDERVYLNADTFPAHIGTGTEDYYGYAWGMADYFSSPFISSPARDIADRGNWQGYTTTSRMRLLDSIPVESALKIDMEIWNWADTHVDYAVATFWYGKPGVVTNRAPQPEELNFPIHPIPELPGTIHIPGAIECEVMPIAQKTDGIQTETQNAGLKEGGWSAGKQLFVRASHIGDFITLEIPTADNSPVNVVLYATRSYDYGVLKFRLNDVSVSLQFDGYSEISKASGAISLGTVTPVDHKILLRAEVAGANPHAKGAKYFFGLDCVTLVK